MVNFGSATTGYTGADSFTYTVSDGKLTSTGTISLNVRASQRDDDDDDHCHGRSGNGNSNNGNRSASVTVTSSASGNGNRRNYDDRDIHYVVINPANSQFASQSTSQGTAAASATTSTNGLAVNWQAGSTNQTIAASPPSQGQSWLNQLLSTDNKDKDGKNDLSQKTGLKVKL